MAYTKAAYEGLAWPVTQQGGRLLSVAGNAGLARFTSSGSETSETIDVVHALFDRVVGASALTLEIHESSNLPQSVVTDTFRPNADALVDNWQDEGGATTDLYQSIDESTLDTSDYIHITTGASDRYRSEFDSGGGLAPSSPRVLSLRVKAVVEKTSTVGSGGDVRARVVSGGTFGDEWKTVSHSDGQVTLTWTWEHNPDTLARWTESDVQDFDSGSSIQFEATLGSLHVYQVWVEVDSHEAPAAVADAIVDGDGWQAFTLDSSWSKASGTDFAVLVYKTNSDGQCVWTSLDSGGDCPHVSWRSHLPTMGDATGLVDSLGDEQTAVHPLVLEASGGSASADSQPYAQLVRESVHSGRTVEQEVTPGSSLTAGWVRLVAACHPDTAADLEVEVRDRSDDSVVGTLAVAPADLPDPDSPRKLQQVDGPLDSTGSVDTSQHYVHLSSTEPSETAWEVAVLDADSPPVSAESAGFGGTTDQATVDGTEDDDLDAPVVFAAVPSTPSGFTASAGSDAGEVDLSWTATSLGGSFDRYLISRGNHVIAEVTDESITALTDTGALQGVQETWAIQVKDTDGIVSVKATDTATASVLSDGSHRVTSLHDPAVNLSIRAAADQMTWRFPNRVSQQRQMGRDGHKVLRAKRGKAEVLEITANLGVGQPEQDRDLFDDLLALRDADVPHLTLTTIWGHRMLCAVRVEEGSERQIADWGQATVRLVSVGERPTPVVIDAA